MSAEPFPEIDDLEVPDYPDDEHASLIDRMEWHAARIAWYRRKVAEKQAERDRMVARYQQWYDKTTEPWRRKIAESEAFITYAHLDAVDADPKHPKVLHLPSGVVRTVAPRPSVVVEDAEAFRLWVTGRDDVEELARWKCEVNKTAVKELIVGTGEVVPGCRLEDGERKVTISVDDD